MLSIKELSRHMKSCALKPENNVEEGPNLRDRLFGIASAQSTMSQPISSELWSVLGKKHKDDVSTAGTIIISCSLPSPSLISMGVKDRRMSI